MQINKDKVVAIHYTLRDDKGNILDSSDGREPLHFLQGNGNLIIGMEEGLEGHSKGDKFQIQVSPEKGYGVRDESQIQKVPAAAFGDHKPEVGMQFRAGDHQVVTVTEVENDMVTVDGNHPLAGLELHFDVEVVDVREATKEEISHGHVHGPGGHHHH